MANKTFILYDGRAKCGDSDDSIAMDVAHSEQEAHDMGAKGWKGHDAIWYECDDEGNETPRPDLPPCSPATQVSSLTTKEPVTQADKESLVRQEKLCEFAAHVELIAERLGITTFVLAAQIVDDEKQLHLTGDPVDGHMLASELSLFLGEAIDARETGVVPDNMDIHRSGKSGNRKRRRRHRRRRA